MTPKQMGQRSADLLCKLAQQVAQTATTAAELIYAMGEDANWDNAWILAGMSERYYKDAKYLNLLVATLG